MKPEAKLKQEAVNKLVAYGGDAQHHEDKDAVGIPDLSYGLQAVNGWVETKVLNKWPKRGGVVKIDHYTPQQKNWLRIRGRIGGHCFLLLKVDNVYLLFDHETAQAVYTGMTQDEMMCNCLFWSVGELHTQEFLAYLTK